MAICTYYQRGTCRFGGKRATSHPVKFGLNASQNNAKMSIQEASVMQIAVLVVPLEVARTIIDSVVSMEIGIGLTSQAALLRVSYITRKAYHIATISQKPSVMFEAFIDGLSRQP